MVTSLIVNFYALNIEITIIQGDEPVKILRNMVRN